jgi:hypothetical protein
MRGQQANAMNSVEEQRCRTGVCSRRGQIVAEFTEIETGKGADALERRPQLAAALKAAKRAKA